MGMVPGRRRKMKLIKDEKVGGDKVEHDAFSLGGIFAGMPKKGETEAVLRRQTYETELSIPFRFTVESELKPGKLANGKSKRRNKESRVIDVEISFPFDRGNLTGSAKLYIGMCSQEELAERIRKAIGNLVVDEQVNREALRRD